MVASSKRRAMPPSQRSGRTLSGPKKAKLLHRAAKLQPTSWSSAIAAHAALGRLPSARARVGAVAGELGSGSGTPRKVPKARRKTRSASGSSASANGSIVSVIAPSDSRSPRQDATAGDLIGRRRASGAASLALLLLPPRVAAAGRLLSPSRTASSRSTTRR
ncbi:MAG: hypothetical protein U0802_21450 [Candidatus Binatia bacterium]